MAVTRESPFATRTSRIVLGFTVATSLCAAVAAAPSAPTGLKGPSTAPVKATVSLNDDGLRPLARGPAIRVGRAFGGEDEDCTLVMTPKTDAKGHVSYARELSCVN